MLFPVKYYCLTLILELIILLSIGLSFLQSVWNFDKNLDALAVYQDNPAANSHLICKFPMVK